MIELLTTGAAFIAALVAVWNRLRVGRYRDRWQAALKLQDESPTDAGEWDVFLDNKNWIVTNGNITVATLDADMNYPYTSDQNRLAAEQLASNLNSGKIKVA